MSLFRKRTLHKLIEETTSWEPTIPNSKRRRDIKRGSRGDADSGEGMSKNASSYLAQGGVRRQGTINLIKNLMKHRVNIVRNEIEYDEISESEGDGGADDGNHLRRMLQ